MPHLISYAEFLGITADPFPSEAQTASDYLSTLLQQPGPYRETWTSNNDRHNNTINRAAIARVLTRQLAQEGISKGHRNIKDTVARALNGTALTQETLSLFISAFRMSEEDATLLWRLHTRNESNESGRGEKT